MKAPTLRDVAREAGVGSATADRVLHARGGVRSELAVKVIKAAKSLGYGERRKGLTHGIIRIEVILVRPEVEFYARLNRTFENIAASLDRSIVVHRTFVKEGDAAAIAEYISKPSFNRAGLIVLVPNHPTVSASIAQARESGVEVVQMLTKSADESIPYVGIDNYAAGRTAAYFVSSMLSARTGKIVAMCNSAVYGAQRDRIRGFTDFLSERNSPGHFFSKVLFGQDDNVLSAEVLSEALKVDQDIIGLYTVGDGRLGVASVLENQKAKVFWIGHALTNHTAKCLRSGLMDIVIDGAPEVQARLSIDTILRRLGLIDTEVSTDPVQFLTITAQNLADRRNPC